MDNPQRSFVTIYSNEERSTTIPFGNYNVATGVGPKNFQVGENPLNRSATPLAGKAEGEDIV